MTRALLSLVVALLGFVILIGAVALLAYGGEPQRDGTLRVAGLEGDVRISWSDVGEVTIEADDEAALWTGLGYAHAADHGWSMALWRQSALGQLSLWSGPDALDLDRHARQLGFAALARQAYASLPADDRAAVDSYARGVRLAFADEAVAERDEFIELDVTAEPWEPWHALAIERLIAWLGTDPLPTTSENDALADFARADSLFRGSLALGGLSHARAYVSSTDASVGDGNVTLVDPFEPGPILVFHQPYGASALPLLIGARLALGGREQVVATVPGTLLLPASTGAWAAFLTSDAAVDRDTSATPAPVFSRLIDREGDESLYEILRDSSGLVLSLASMEPRDTLAVDAETGAPVLAAPSVESQGTRLRWLGFQASSDVGAFRALLSGATPSFRLFRGDGLMLQRGVTTVLGAPPVVREGPGWRFASASTSGAPATLRLETLARDSSRLSPSALALDVGSPWALTQSQALIRGLGNRDSLSRDLQDAYAFLRGWDGLYTPEAIAPSIAEAWIDAHREIFGRGPDLSQPHDSALATFTLRLGVARLRDSLGTTAGRWTWDRLAGRLRQPLLDGVPRYAPALALAGGHPTSPLPGPSLVLESPPGPAVFSFWTEGLHAMTDHPALPVVRTEGRDARLVRSWRPPSPDRPSLRLVPA